MTIIFITVLEILAKTIRQEKEVYRFNDWKERD